MNNEIQFVEVDTEKLVNELIKSYEMFSKRTLYPADPIRQFILWIASVIIQERILINESAKQNMLRYARGENLDELAELFKDTQRLEAQHAICRFRFYLSEDREQLIPKGSKITMDGEIIFETVEDLVIKKGSLYGEVIGRCQLAGTIGNGFVPGQINQLIDLPPFFEKVENIDTSSGGSEKETDLAFYKRLRGSVETYTTAGAEGAYKYHIMAMSTEIIDVSVKSHDKGTVTIRVLLKEGVNALNILSNIRREIQIGDVKPLTDKVVVLAPSTVPYDVQFTYYKNANDVRQDEVISKEIDKAVQVYSNWQSSKIGRDINPSYLITLLMQTGIKRVEVVAPVYTAVNDESVARLKNYKAVNGGYEDE